MPHGGSCRAAPSDSGLLRLHDPGYDPVDGPGRYRFANQSWRPSTRPLRTCRGQREAARRQSAALNASRRAAFEE